MHQLRWIRAHGHAVDTQIVRVVYAWQTVRIASACLPSDGSRRG